ncbi:unnamed protein product, partial [Nesidiocoris tenuis]
MSIGRKFAHRQHGIGKHQTLLGYIELYWTMLDWTVSGNIRQYLAISDRTRRYQTVSDDIRQFCAVLDNIGRYQTM